MLPFLADQPIATSYMSPNAGGGGGCRVSAKEYSCTKENLIIGSIPPPANTAKMAIYTFGIFQSSFSQCGRYRCCQY
jgi:hypothetical protein